MYLSVKLGIWGLVLVVGQIEDFELLVSSLVYFFKFLDLVFLYLICCYCLVFIFNCSKSMHHLFVCLQKIGRRGNESKDFKF